MFRLLFLTFFGDCRADEHTQHHLHESPPSMTMPLIVLAVLSVVGGYVGLPADWLWGNASRSSSRRCSAPRAERRADQRHDGVRAHGRVGADGAGRALASAYLFYIAQA